MPCRLNVSSFPGFASSFTRSLNTMPSHLTALLPLNQRKAKRKPIPPCSRLGSHIGHSTVHRCFGMPSYRSTPPAYSEHFWVGVSPLLLRAGGGSSDGKKGKIPLLTPLTASSLGFLDFIPLEKSKNPYKSAGKSHGIYIVYQAFTCPVKSPEIYLAQQKIAKKIANYLVE